MSKGLIKGKNYDWKDSNLALFGSDTEKQVKKSSAETEPAWKKAGKEVGVQIWRVEKFEVKDWLKEDYGQFYNGDSYVILHTYKNPEDDSLAYNVFFWIGKHSSQDEYGTAAYKTVELDTYLNDVPVQHRECQDHESNLFKSLFKNGITIMEGGCDSGFRNLPPEEYVPRLFHICKDKSGHIEFKQIPRDPKLISEDDVYILDMGLIFYQYNGAQSSPFERAKAMQHVARLKESRVDADSEVIEGGSGTNNEFWKNLNEKDDRDKDNDGIPDRKLLRVNTETGNAEVVKEGKFGLGDLSPDDVFILDTSDVVYVWIGSKASPNEKKNGLPYAHNYLRTSGFPYRPIAVYTEGQENQELKSAVNA